MKVVFLRDFSRKVERFYFILCLVSRPNLIYEKLDQRWGRLMSLSRYYQNKKNVFEFTMINKLVFIYHERIHHRRGFSRDYRVVLLSYWPKLPCRHFKCALKRTVSTSLQEMWGGGGSNRRTARLSRTGARPSLHTECSSNSLPR